jgi:hypothetical protein
VIQNDKGTVVIIGKEGNNGHCLKQVQLTTILRSGYQSYRAAINHIELEPLPQSPADSIKSFITFKSLLTNLFYDSRPPNVSRPHFPKFLYQKSKTHFSIF